MRRDNEDRTAPLNAIFLPGPSQSSSNTANESLSNPELDPDDDPLPFQLLEDQQFVINDQNPAAVSVYLHLICRSFIEELVERFVGPS